MVLITAINRHLTDELLTQLAGASALPVAAARATATGAVPVLVQALALPVDADETNARWDMCRQLYLSQLLTQPDELLRTDLGWPDRRRYLAQKILEVSLVAALAEPTGQPTQASTLLGYLTTIALAVVGEQVITLGLPPQSLGSWLAQQPVPGLRPVAVLAGLPYLQPARPALAAKLAVWSVVVGGAAVSGLVGGYFLLGRP
ncbi:MAG: hypothetical protein EOO56_16665, partial [Hymenobacter sp.]